MKRTMLAVFTILIAAALEPVMVPAGEPHRPGGRAVFVDPAFGGKASGPVLGGKTAGKDVTLALAKGLYEGLAKRGISVHVSRRRDVALTDDQRMAKARATGADIYIAIRVSKDSRNCVQISVPGLPAPSPGDRTDDYMMNLHWEKQMEQSRELAGAAFRGLKNRGVPLCGDIGVQNDAALEKVLLPAVIIDWKTGGNTAAGPAPVDAGLQRTIAAALAEGLGEYSAASSGNAPRQR